LIWSIFTDVVDDWEQVSLSSDEDVDPKKSLLANKENEEKKENANQKKEEVKDEVLFLLYPAFITFLISLVGSLHFIPYLIGLILDEFDFYLRLSLFRTRQKKKKRKWRTTRK
jgi:hypothetical protein